MLDPLPEAPDAEIDPNGPGVLVFKTPHKASDETIRHMHEHLQPLFPGRQILILCDGMELQDMGAAARTEAKIDRLQATVDRLLEFLAAEEDPDGDEPAFTLDGAPAGRERDQNQSLG